MIGIPLPLSWGTITTESMNDQEVLLRLDIEPGQTKEGITSITARTSLVILSGTGEIKRKGEFTEEITDKMTVKLPFENGNYLLTNPGPDTLTILEYNLLR